jgi:hypothetical protein
MGGDRGFRIAKTEHGTPESDGQTGGGVRSEDMIPGPPDPAEDPEFDPEEIAEATAEMHTDVTAPEVDEKTEELTVWDEPLAESGRVVPKVPLEDEVPLGETLTYEGVDEADRERRIAAADPDFEP